MALRRVSTLKGACTCKPLAELGPRRVSALKWLAPANFVLSMGPCTVGSRGPEEEKVWRAQAEIGG
eukprot:5031965-Heterocapsa_arctica.AAC.1